MLPDKETTNTEEDMSEDQQDEGQLHNASAESDPLDSEQKAASEADTLPIEKKVEGLEVAKSESKISPWIDRCLTNCGPFLVSENPLPNNASRRERLLHSIRCPPHGKFGRFLALFFLVLALWATCIGMFGNIAKPIYTKTDLDACPNITSSGANTIDENFVKIDANPLNTQGAEISTDSADNGDSNRTTTKSKFREIDLTEKVSLRPCQKSRTVNGTLFILILLVVLALFFGWIVSLVKLPPLLGMLLTGIVIKNIPGVEFDEYWVKTSGILRGTALVVILMRAGLGLDPQALKRLSGMVFRLAFTPCLVETLTVAVASHFLLDFEWMWGFMLGFVLAAVSPAVVVPCLLGLQEAGYGTDKGIPTLVIAAASVDDVLAISGFTILLGITFKPDQNIYSTIFQGPKEAIIGLLFGIAWGILVIGLPGKDDPKMGKFRFVLLTLGGLLAYFGSKAVELDGSGALAVLVMAFVAGIGWRRMGWTDDNIVNSTLADFWMIFQPILFGLIGTEIQVSKLEPEVVGLGIAVLIIGLTIRIIVSYFSVLGGDLNLKERLFVTLAWLPKATVQAALGPVALDNLYNSGLDPGDDLYKTRYVFSSQILQIAVLVILITAPLGSIAITLSGPKLLKKSDSNDIENTIDNNARNDTQQP